MHFGGLAGTKDGEVQACPDDDTNEDLVRDFDDDIREEEGLPGVCFGRALADLIEGALKDKAGYDLEFVSEKAVRLTTTYLLHKGRECCSHHEDGKQRVLQASG